MTPRINAQYLPWRQSHERWQAWEEGRDTDGEPVAFGATEQEAREKIHGQTTAHQGMESVAHLQSRI